MSKHRVYQAKHCSHVTILEDSGARALVNLHFWNFCPFFSIMEQDLTHGARATAAGAPSAEQPTPGAHACLTPCEPQLLLLLILADKRIKIIIRSATTRQRIKDLIIVGRAVRWMLELPADECCCVVVCADPSRVVKLRDDEDSNKIIRQQSRNF